MKTIEEGKNIPDEVWIRFLLYCCFRNTYKCIEIFRRRFGEYNVDSNVYEAKFRNLYRNLLCQPVHITSIIQLAQNTFGIENPLVLHYLAALYLTGDTEDFMQEIRYLCDRAAHNEGVKSIIPCNKDDIRFSVPIIFIHFDKVEVVQNENPAIRTMIYDYFVGVYAHFGILGHDGFLSTARFIGAKTTFTHVQMCAEYVHSHRQHGNDATFARHCTGNEGSPINACTKTMLNYMETHYDVPTSLIKLFAENLNTYLGVESQTGHPYMHILNLNYQSIDPFIKPKDRMCPGLYTHEKVIATKMFGLNNKLRLIKFSAHKTGVFFTTSEEDILVQMTNLYLLCGGDCGLVKAMRKNGHFFYPGSAPEAHQNNNVQKITLCGREYKLRVLPADDDDIVEYQLLSPPIFFAYYRFFIEEANKIIFEE